MFNTSGNKATWNDETFKAYVYISKKEIKLDKKLTISYL